MAIDAGDLRLPIRTSKQTGSVAKEVLEVAEADYKFVLRHIAAQEIAQQARIGNKVTNLIVDGSGSKPITAAERSVRALFVQPGLVMRAVRDAWDALQRIARVGDPATQTPSQRGIVARERFAIVIGQTFIGGPGALTESAISTAPNAPIRIVGPLVEYTRKYRFLNSSGGRLTRLSKAKRNRGQKVRVSASIHEIVIAQMKRRYPMLRWSDDWIPAARLRFVDRVPTVTVRSQTRGRLL